MTPIDSLPDLEWSEFATREILATGESLVTQSDFAYQIGQVAIAGLTYTSYTSPPWFWFALSKNVTIKDLLDFRALREKIPVGSQTAVNVAWPRAARFAEFYGFEDMNVSTVVGNETYKIFRRV